VKRLTLGIVFVIAFCVVLSSLLTACGSSTTTAGSTPTTTTANIKTTAPASTMPKESKNSVSTVPSAASVKPGDTFDVAIRVTNEQPSRGMQFSLMWDPSKVECTSVDQGGYYKDFAAANKGELFLIPSDKPVADNDAGVFPKTNDPLHQMMIAMQDAHDAGGTPLGVTGTGDVFILLMAVKSGASGQVDFTLSQVLLSDASLEPKDMKPDVINGKITITP